ncbi:OmpA family protein [Oricola sp.]|uniref:OmpA family protein n=1 Tax=Oricola sp. TaxID=1979950 RepID=UPI0025EEF395|nr:OmpA family protein [Oricola sp.]MCI5076128.1 OmpA family protein [Oricola sp.]
MKRATATLLVAAWMLGAPGALAEDVSSTNIINTLKPKVATRNIFGDNPAGMSEEESAFVSRLRGITRDINVQERDELAEIVQQNDLPSIDLEIYFDYNSAGIGPQAKPGLIELGLALRSDALKDIVFLVSGHTDAVGSDAYNQDLSERRAKSVKAFLTETFLIETDRLIAVGYGEEQLKNTYDPAAAENRRVTIVSLVQ